MPPEGVEGSHELYLLACLAWYSETADPVGPGVAGMGSMAAGGIAGICVITGLVAAHPGEAVTGRCASPAAPSACKRAGSGRGHRWEVVPQRAAFEAADPQRDVVAGRRYAAGGCERGIAQGAGGR